MAKRAAQTCHSFWGRRGLRLLAALALAALVVGLLGVVHVPLAAACTPQAPTNTTLPAMTPTGYGSYNTLLSTTAGSWQPNCSTMAAPSYQWYRGTTPISGGTLSGHTTTAADGSSVLTVRVTRCTSTLDDCTTVTSTGTFQHSVAPTVGTATISGTVQVGQTLTANASNLTLGTPTGTVSYQWQYSITAGGTYSNISGATNSTYVVPNSYYNKYLKVVITADNTVGSCQSGCSAVSATSAATSAVQGIAPSGCGVLTGSPYVGQVLTASCSAPGYPTSTYTYQWKYSTTAGGTYNNVASGGTGSTYTVPSTYYQDYLEVYVSATNAAGSSSGTSAAIGPIGGRKAYFCLADATGSSENSSSGVEPYDIYTASYTCQNYGYPAATFTYQWEYSATVDGPYTPVASGGTSATYLLDPAYVDDYIEVVITGTNTCSSGCGSTSATSSPPIGPVSGWAPVAGSAAISGTAQVGGTLTATPSGFNLGAPTATYSYQWQYSTSSSGTYADIAGATSSNYVVDPAYYDDYLRVVITASNSCISGCGPASAISPASSQVLPAAPSGGTVSITGTAQLGYTLTATPCSAQGWSPSAPAPTCTYQWQDSPDGVSNWINATGSGATTPSYIVHAADSNEYLRVVVTATNPGGSGTASGSPVHPQVQGPTGSVGPTGGVGPTGPVGPSGGEFGPTGMYAASPDSNGFTAPLWGLRRLKYHSGGPKRYGTRASIDVTGADPKATTACILFDSVVTEIDQAKRRQFELGVARCKNTSVDACPTESTPFLYVETEKPNPNSTTKSDYSCTFEGTTSTGTTHRLGLRKKTEGGDVWEAIIGTKTLSSPTLGSFDDYVQISEWGEYHGKSDACTSSWNASANFKDWQQYVFGTGWVTLHGSQSAKLWTPCPSNTEIWHVGDLIYKPTEDSNHLLITRSH